MDYARLGKSARAVRYIACSNFEALQIAEANEVCRVHDLENPVAIQPPYNLLQRSIEQGLLPYCQRERARGLLTGKYMNDRSPRTGTRASHNANYWNLVNRAEYFKYLEEIQKVAQEMNVSMSQLAVAWILKNPVVTSPLIGASSMEQVEENCRILEVKITDETYAKLNELTKTCEAKLY
jgi:aryl-alcohol dehydrogenase-like predicted oxidoreductase